MGRSPCCDETGLKKGPWTPEEDHKLIEHIQKHGHGSWRALPKLAGLNRCGKSCRLRWTNYLRPDIKRGKFSHEEEQTILHLHSILGNKWSAIAGHLPGRTDNEIKNFWNTNLKKKLIHMGFDPMTHRPHADIFSNLPHLFALANLKELLDHNSLQAKAAHMANLQHNYLQCLLQPPVAATTSSDINISTFSDLETNNLLNSLASFNENPVSGLPKMLDLSNTSLQGLDTLICFSHLPDLQAPCSYQTPLNKGNTVQGHDDQLLVFGGPEENSSNNSSWLYSSSSTTPSPTSVTAPLITHTSINNLGDASSTSSYGCDAASLWPEPDLLIEDPLFHEIA